MPAPGKGPGSASGTGGPGSMGGSGQGSPGGADKSRDLGGYTTGNPYPGYRGPTGTRNPAKTPSPPSQSPGYSPMDKPPKESIWDKFFGSSSRRKLGKAPSYEASLANLAKLATRSIPGPGMISGAIADIAGVRPGYTGYGGSVNTPGEWDAKDLEKTFPNGGLVPQGGLPDYTSIFYNLLPR